MITKFLPRQQVSAFVSISLLATVPGAGCCTGCCDAAELDEITLTIRLTSPIANHVRRPLACWLRPPIAEFPSVPRVTWDICVVVPSVPTVAGTSAVLPDLSDATSARNSANCVCVVCLVCLLCLPWLSRYALLSFLRRSRCLSVIARSCPDEKL
jgi:hypothetical protein